MKIVTSVALSAYSTMRLGGIADYLVEIYDRFEVRSAFAWAKERNVPVIMIGGGSNIVWRDEGFRGLVIVNKISGYEDIDEGELGHFVTVGAGEPWDSVVARTVAAGLTGIEALSLIPGTAGATPVQNVGAYGQEVAQTITSIEVYDASTNHFMNIPSEQCGFGYRRSRFQTDYRNKYCITAVTFHLMQGNPPTPYYGAIEHYLEEHNHTGTITPQIIRDAVIAIRSSKLPDPATIANNGSFFANPIISAAQLVEFQSNFPDAPLWPLEDGSAKIPAAWLIQTAGFKDYHDKETGMATWPAQPLVLVNEQATRTSDLLAFRDKVINAVTQKFGITLVQEPELLP
jgi:UDP-N-acetylmuramate dehydrogenase